MTIRPASKKHVVPCPKCGQGWPTVQTFWETIDGKKQLICCCSHCGIMGTIVPKTEAKP
jgi:hypothetical protein